MQYFQHILLFFLSSFVMAQYGGVLSYPDARTVAIGSQAAVTSTGVYSILANPANLAMQGTTIEISTILPIPSINAVSGNDFMSFSDIEYYFGGVKDENGNVIGRFLDPAEKETLLSKFNEGNRIQTSAAINLFSISVSAGKDIGNFGFSINDVLGQRTGLPRDLIDLFLNGNRIGRTYYLNDLVFSTSYLREYNFSYARDFSFLLDNIFKSFSAGITFKLVHGYAYTEIKTVGTTIKTLEDHSILIENNFDANIAVSQDFGINWDFDDVKNVQNISPFLNPAGVGFGVNLGFAAVLDSIWTFGLSITDIGTVSWDNNPVSYKSQGSFLISDVTDSTLTDSIQAALEPIGSYSDGFTSQLPTVLRLGASFRLDRFLKGNFPGKMLLVVGYNQGFNNSLNNTTSPLFSLGFEWKPIDLFPIRSGFTFGGFTGFAWSLGLGIDAEVVEFNFASADVISALSGNDTRVVQFTIGSRWKF